MMRFREHNAEVLYAEDPIVQVDREDIEFLVKRAFGNPRKRIRLCAHKNVGDPLHEMLIVHARDCYVRPHKHAAKSESFHIVRGAVDIVLFDEAARIIEVVPMGDYSTGRKFFYRLADPYYHTLLIHSDYVVFHEITNGPFDRADTIFAPWAPVETDPVAVRSFMNELARSVDNWNKT
ncbi:MAG TPA: WbuC family cupin fold metalloprotein [Verrucomicrobiae bacterium]|nr:WbuC family cupin fold metalloprotein [Verrucomicrobiae bacterium]